MTAGQRTTLPVAAERRATLPALEPQWLRRRSASYWALQVFTYLFVLAIDWVLTVFDPSTLKLQFSAMVTSALLGLFVVVYSLIIVRRRWPVLAFALVASLTLAVDLTGYAAPFLGLLVTLHTVAASCSARVAQVALGAAAIPIVVMSYWTAHYSAGHDHTTADFLIPLVFFGLVTLITWLLGRRDQRSQLHALELRRQVEVSESTAAARERHRIARELHDILSHSVSAMMMQAAGARALARSISRDVADDPRLGVVEDALNTIEETGSQSMRELHRLLGALRDESGALDLPNGGLLEIDFNEASPPEQLDLHRLVDLSRRSGLTVEIHHSGDHHALDPSVNAAAYRVVQESLTNALKHAGRGAVVDVFETWQDERFQLQIRSRAGHDAALPSTTHGGTGLLGLRERVELVGGTFEAGWVGDEFVTTAVLPLTSKASSGHGAP